MKKTMLYLLAIIGFIVGIAGLILASITINEKNRIETFKEQPTYEEVEKEMEFWLLSDNIDIKNKKEVKNYVVYYAKDCNYNDRYYAIMYKLKSGSLMSYYWEYSHWIESDYHHYEYGR